MSTAIPDIEFDPNEGLLRQTLATIKEKQDRWWQAGWSTLPHSIPLVVDENLDPVQGQGVHCGTAFCFAGWVATLNEGLWLGESFLLAVPDDTRRLIRHVSAVDEAGNLVDTMQVEATPVWHRAQRLLGLDNGCADALFDAANTLGALTSMVEELCAGRHLIGCKHYDNY